MRNVEIKDYKKLLNKIAEMKEYLCLKSASNLPDKLDALNDCQNLITKIEQGAVVLSREEYNEYVELRNSEVAELVKENKILGKQCLDWIKLYHKQLTKTKETKDQAYREEIKQDFSKHEEIAKEMSKQLCCYYDSKKKKCSNCFGMEEDCDLHCNFGRTLERLSKAGYHKIDKGSVVLSMEEYQNDCSSQFKKGYKYGSKETAERDFNHIIKALEIKKPNIITNYSIKESVGVDIAIRIVKKLAKQLGVEIKE